MPTIQDKLKFNFNGVWSDEYDLINVVLDNSMYEEDFVAPREIIETRTRGSNRPLFHSLDSSPLEFEMNIAFGRKMSDSEIDEIVRWLFVDYYKPLYFENKEDKIYMAMPVESSRIIHNGLNEGFLTLRMRCDSSHTYSPVILSPSTSITTSEIITIKNDGHFIVYPEISIKKNGTGIVTIESLSDNGSIFEIRDLTNQEDIYLNSEKEIIETDIVGVYRYDKIIGEFPRILIGENRFKVTGNCSIQFRYTNKYKF